MPLVASIPTAPEERPSPPRAEVEAERRWVRPSHSRCAALFADATAARSASRPAEAIARFQRLERECSGTPEATVSLVSLGELLVDAHELEPALACFETYLRQALSGPLAPEALAAKARLLERLGQSSEADKVRIQLQHRVPDWPYTSGHREGE
jgi:tetratricopeptide (TPR) repeat protein